MDDHLDMWWVAWMDEGVAWAAQHLGAPFGATSAVYAFHRFGSFLAAAVRRLGRAPLGRYVDDFFGASRIGVYWTGARMLSVLTELIGRPCDAAKNVDDAESMGRPWWPVFS